MRHYIAFILFFLALAVVSAQTTTTPAAMPYVSPADSTQFYTISGGAWKKFSIGMLKTKMTADGLRASGRVTVIATAADTSTVTGPLEGDIAMVGTAPNFSTIYVRDNSVWRAFAGGGSSVLKIENTNTTATAGTSNNYHRGRIGVGDFSGNSIARPLHVYETDQAVIRLSDSAAVDSQAISYVEFFRGYGTYQVGAVGKLFNTDKHLYFRNNVSGGSLVFQTDGTTNTIINSAGQWNLPRYDAGAFDGTIVKYLGLDANENIVTGAGGGGATVSAYTPTGRDDATGSAGDLAYDTSYVYVKTSVGWKRSALEVMPLTPPAFSPTDILGLVAWWDPSQETEYTNNQNVDTLRDWSGNNYHLTSATNANRPDYKTALQGGKSGLSFTATDSLSNVTGLITGTAARTVILLVRATTSTSSNSIFNLNGRAGGSPTSGTVYAVTTEIAVRVAGGSRVFDSALSTANFQVIALTSAASSNVSAATAYLNDTALGQTSVTPLAINTGTTGVVLGISQGFVAGQAFDFLEGLVYDSALGTSELTQIYNYLVDKWSL